MTQTLSFLIALVIVNTVFSSMVGFGLQYLAYEAELGPLPRSFLGMGFSFLVVIILMFDFSLSRFMFIPLMIVYYIGIFQIGMPIGHWVGFKAPDDNSPPQIFFDMINKF